MEGRRGRERGEGRRGKGRRGEGRRAQRGGGETGDILEQGLSVNPLVPDVHYVECQDKVASLRSQQLEVNR